MLEHSKAKKWIDENIDGLMLQYGIPHWKITVEYFFDSSEKAHSAEVFPQCKYEQALVRINCERIDSLAELEKVLRHEFGHIVISPFHLFEEAVFDALETTPNSKALAASLSSIWHSADELAVKNLERMHNGHKEFFNSPKNEAGGEG